MVRTIKEPVRDVNAAAEEVRRRRRRGTEKRNPLTGRLSGKRIEVEYLGRTQCLAKWARELGIRPQIIGNRYARGYPLELVFRIGKVSKGEHPETEKSYREQAIPEALKLVFSLTWLHKRAFSSAEILAKISEKSCPNSEKALATNRFLMSLLPLTRSQFRKIESPWTINRIFKILARYEYNSLRLVKTAGKWQWQKSALA